jgi:predicted nucleic acid-binding protein
MAQQTLLSFGPGALSAEPSGLDETLRFRSLLLSQPYCVVIQPGARHWEIFTNRCAEANARSNLAPDAWLVALAIESGCRWIMLDRHYALFSRLQWCLPGEFR